MKTIKTWGTARCENRSRVGRPAGMNAGMSTVAATFAACSAGLRRTPELPDNCTEDGSDAATTHPTTRRTP